MAGCCGGDDHEWSRRRQGLAMISCKSGRTRWQSSSEPLCGGTAVPNGCGYDAGSNLHARMYGATRCRCIQSNRSTANARAERYAYLRRQVHDTARPSRQQASTGGTGGTRSPTPTTRIRQEAEGKKVFPAESRQRRGFTRPEAAVGSKVFPTNPRPIVATTTKSTESGSPDNRHRRHVDNVVHDAAK